LDELVKDSAHPEKWQQGNYEVRKPGPELYLKFMRKKITRQWTRNYFNRKDYLKAPDGDPIILLHFPQDRGIASCLLWAELIPLSAILKK